MSDSTATVGTSYTAATPNDIHRYIFAALANSDHTQLLPLATKKDAQIIMNEIWKDLDSHELPESISSMPFQISYRGRLRRLSLKIAVTFNILPGTLRLKGVQCGSREYHLAGAFADVFMGTYGELKVALKRVRVYIMTEDELKDELEKAFYRESILWKNLTHEHVLPFLGISDDAIPSSLCIVSPWMSNGSLRSYLSNELHQTALGLEYLHGEGVVHGDLHAGNILVDETGTARLTDFGLSLLADGGAYNYGSHHGGGAIRWSAPELFAPEEFGLDSSRPTVHSDVYSFGCICVELYTLKPLYPELADMQVPLRVVHGERPSRPSAPGGELMGSALWTVAQACWAPTPNIRPTTHDITSLLSTIVQSSSQSASTSIFQLAMIHCIAQAHLKHLPPDEFQANWLRTALVHTDAFHRNGAFETAHWVLAAGKNVPDGAFVSSRTRRGEPVYVIRAPIITTLQIGQAISSLPKGGVVGFALKCIDVEIYEVLIVSSQHVQWVPAHGKFVLPQGIRPVEAGHDFDDPLYIAQAWIDGEWRSGKVNVAWDHAHVMFGTEECVVSDYRVLCYYS
ncbi:hypothetical protein EIP91_000431 [Steccherinum ochraceum]|uniref:Protein kinase domain-containing protein n=1 Tax=Steccherinum ochraceum TaxID=92696 RepID=A0A4V2MWQ4_9APHY|nr:hypothetical protein EIP91_000431 [Steccherinum ochraceum]